MTGLPREYLAGLRILILSIPSGRVISYGDAAEVIGYGSARHSAKALSLGVLSPQSHSGAGEAEDSAEQLPWWRVIRSDGTITSELVSEAAQHWEREQTPRSQRRRKGRLETRVLMSSARWAPTREIVKKIDEAIERAASAEENATEAGTSMCPGDVVNS